jgi:hypothetical protein
LPLAPAWIKIAERLIANTFPLRQKNNFVPADRNCNFGGIAASISANVPHRAVKVQAGDNLAPACILLPAGSTYKLDMQSPPGAIIPCCGDDAMSAETPYPINLEPKYAPLELIDIPALVSACKDRWYNQTLCKVNDCVVRLGVAQGEFHWHRHENEDEFF